MKTIITYVLAGIGLVTILSSVSEGYDIDEEMSNTQPLGPFSISLAVEDINASLIFYEKIGFQQIDGEVNQNWVILKNGSAKIGLFQGMFPTNTITFNPVDGRTIYAELTAQKIEPTFTIGMDVSEGPCSFSINDPDGNPILIDQH